MDSDPRHPLGETSRQYRGMRLVAEHAGRTLRSGRVVLRDATVSAERGELLAIAGGSGAGKTSLLELLAGFQTLDEGRVTADGRDIHEHRAWFREQLAYVPQDDIIHSELPLRRTLQHAARLRLPITMASSEVDAVVESAMKTLGLSSSAEVRVGALSGGQRKRASIAVELMTDPTVFFLDEPTSGLDPATSTQLMVTLRRLADNGATVLLTTHSVQDISLCDRVIFLAPDGRVAFAGRPGEALTEFGVDDLAAVYGQLPSAPSFRPTWVDDVFGPTPVPPSAARLTVGPRRPGFLRQWAVLTQRTFETLARNRLTMAILLGAPVIVVCMFAILFRPGAFDPVRPSPTAITMIIFWIAFGAFFFGLTYGLLQVVTERAIVRREHLVGLRLGAYLLSKITVLLPFLLFIDVLMVVVLRLLDRLPAASMSTYLSVMITLALDAGAGLTLGLLTSAAVANASQATLALPMLCFPAVLFSGAILPVHVMAASGRAISTAMPDRWAFEGVGHDLRLRELLAEGQSPLGPPLLAAFGPHAGADNITRYWSYLAGFSALFSVAAYLVLRHRLRAGFR